MVGRRQIYRFCHLHKFIFQLEMPAKAPKLHVHLLIDAGEHKISGVLSVFNRGLILWR
jgi:hypothetical protein